MPLLDKIVNFVVFAKKIRISLLVNSIQTAEGFKITCFRLRDLMPKFGNRSESHYDQYLQCKKLRFRTYVQYYFLSFVSPLLVRDIDTYVLCDVFGVFPK